MASNRAASWGWSAAALVLTAALGASVAAVQTVVAGSRTRPPPPEGGAPPEPAAPARPAGARLVVLDPGHGGTNSGARSVVPGVFEKHLTLLLCRAVAKRLAAAGVEVRLTREVDEYVSLRERVARANQLRADLFISIHGNGTETHSQRGYETYVLTPQALDIDSRALRAEVGAPRGADPDTARLLDDVERGLSQVGAAELAAEIQSQLAARRGRDGDRGVRQSSMDVLLGATMPAVLVEVGFIDHPIEGHELLAPEVQGAIADAIADAIRSRL